MKNIWGNDDLWKVNPQNIPKQYIGDVYEKYGQISMLFFCKCCMIVLNPFAI